MHNKTTGGVKTAFLNQIKMENNNYKITGDKSEITATKEFENDSIEITLKPLFGKWDNENGSVDIDIEIVSGMYYTIDSQHPIVLNDEMKLELTEDVFEFVNDDLERFEYDYHNDNNYIAHDYSSEINHKGNE